MSSEIADSSHVPFADILREMDLEFLAMGEYGVTVEEAAGFVHHDHFVFLDLRTKEEHDHLVFPFAMHIPINELLMEQMI